VHVIIYICSSIKNPCTETYLSFFLSPTFNLTLTKSLSIRHGFLFYLYSTLVFRHIIKTSDINIIYYSLHFQPDSVNYITLLSMNYKHMKWKNIMDPCPVNTTSDNSYCFLFWCFCLNYVFECIFILCPNAIQLECVMHF
jgi:hypothetical protein